MADYSKHYIDIEVKYDFVDEQSTTYVINDWIPCRWNMRTSFFSNECIAVRGYAKSGGENIPNYGVDFDIDVDRIIKLKPATVHHKTYVCSIFWMFEDKICKLYLAFKNHVCLEAYHSYLLEIISSIYSRQMESTSRTMSHDNSADDKSMGVFIRSIFSLNERKSPKTFSVLSTILAAKREKANGKSGALNESPSRKSDEKKKYAVAKYLKKKKTAICNWFTRSESMQVQQRVTRKAEERECDVRLSAWGKLEQTINSIADIEHDFDDNDQLADELSFESFVTANDETQRSSSGCSGERSTYSFDSMSLKSIGFNKSGTNCVTSSFRISSARAKKRIRTPPEKHVGRTRLSTSAMSFDSDRLANKSVDKSKKTKNRKQNNLRNDIVTDEVEDGKCESKPSNGKSSVSQHFIRRFSRMRKSTMSFVRSNNVLLFA